MAQVLFATIASVLLLWLREASAQSTSTFGALDVTMTISGTNFNVRFEPENDPVDELANRICTENAGTLGITRETLKGCVDPVLMYLNNAVNEWSIDKTLEVPVNIQGKTFDISFMPEIQSATSMADRLCRQHASLIGVNQETLPACVNPVQNYLQQEVSKWSAEKTLEVSVPIGTNVFEVKFMPERQSAQDMAAQLCVNNANLIGITQETLPSCTDPVTDYLQKAVNQWVLRKTLVTDITLNSMPFTLRFMPERVSSGEMARRLCTEQAGALGLTTREQIIAGCMAPVTDHIANEVRTWTESKTLTVPMNVRTPGIPGSSEQTVQFSFMPEHESLQTLARNFCVQNAAALSLTEQTLVGSCLQPVISYLDNEVKMWMAKRNSA